MKISGMLAGVKDVSYTSKKTQARVELWQLDIYDESYGIASCQITKAKLPVFPTPGVHCVGTISGTRVFNSVVNFSLSEFTEVPGNGSTPAPAAPEGVRPIPSSAPVRK